MKGGWYETGKLSAPNPELFTRDNIKISKVSSPTPTLEKEKKVANL